MTASTERAVLAGGCFWGVQDLLRRYEGVLSTRVGYSGGDVPNATYRNHGTHAEAVEIINTKIAKGPSTFGKGKGRGKAAKVEKAPKAVKEAVPKAPKAKKKAG